jgi:hypothetical protein
MGCEGVFTVNYLLNMFEWAHMCFFNEVKNQRNGLI